MRKDLKFVINIDHIKVPADELLFDIIYIIIISKISEIIFSGNQITLELVVTGLIVFGSLVGVWLMRVNHLNRIHILQHKLETDKFKSDWLTYLEIILLVTLLFTIQTFSFQNLLLIVFVGLVISFMSINRVRHKIIRDSDTHEKFHQQYNPGDRMRKQIEVNVGYVYERFIIVFVLFMGEILSAVFTSSEDPANFFLIIILIVCMYNANVKILNASEKKLIASSNPFIYHGTINYAKSVLVLLLGVLISIEAAHEVVFATLITLIVLVVYFVFEQRMKSIIGLNNNHLVMGFNILTLLVLLLAIPVPNLGKIILGVAVFILNMFYIK